MEKRVYKKYKNGDLVHELMIKYNDIFENDINKILKNYFEFIENNYTNEQKKEFTPNEAVAILIFLIEDYVKFLKKEFNIKRVVAEEEE